MKKRLILIISVLIFGLVPFLLAQGGLTHKWITVTATAYCPCNICCGKHADGKTATGRDAYKPGVAVDPKVIRLGSHLDIPGYKRGPNNNGSWILADDTGSAIKGNKIDVRFKTHREAKEWGVKIITIRVWIKK